MDGFTAVRLLKSIGAARGDSRAAVAYAQSRDDWFDREDIVARLKGAVSGLETSDIGGGSQVGADLMIAARQRSLLRLPLRRVPPLISLLTQTAGSVARWVGEGQARQLSAGTYVRDSLRLLSVAAMTVATNELLADKSMDSEQALLADLLNACIEALDRAFIDPANTGNAATPASVTSTATPIASSGGQIADFDADFAQAIQQLVDAGSNLVAAHWVMSSSLGGRMALMRGSSGALAYPGVGALGGTLAGLPVLTTGAVEATSDGEAIALLDASEVTYSEGAPILKTSENAMIEMDDAPTGDTIAPVGASASPVSMFQTECTALLAQLSVNWKVRRPNMVQVIEGVLIEAQS